MKTTGGLHGKADGVARLVKGFVLLAAISGWLGLADVDPVFALMKGGPDR